MWKTFSWPILPKKKKKLQKFPFFNQNHITWDKCFPGWETHITRDMCFPGGGTHITKDMCFPHGGTHITRDMCFRCRGTHITRNMCLQGWGTNGRSKCARSNVITCIPFILSGSPNKCWLHICDTCVITAWRLGLRETRGSLNYNFLMLIMTHCR